MNSKNSKNSKFGAWKNLEFLEFNSKNSKFGAWKNLEFHDLILNSRDPNLKFLQGKLRAPHSTCFSLVRVGGVGGVITSLPTVRSGDVRYVSDLYMCVVGGGFCCTEDA